MRDKWTSGDPKAHLDSTEHVLTVGPSAPHLLIVAADGTWVSRPLPADGALTIGRDAEVDVRIDEPVVSRRHARLEVAGASDFRLVDLGSVNGTLVGSRLVRGGTVTVRSGEPITIGRTVLAAHALRPARSPEQDPPSPQPGLAMGGVHAMVGRVAPTLTKVLLLGETGVGKGFIAERIHDKSTRAEGPWVQLNCAGLSATLLESELFGHVKGAFTDAKHGKQGLLESATGGTVFLDEIGEMPLDVQAKLLLAIEQRVVRRVGGIRDTPIDVRFIFATNQDLEALVREGRFRADFFFRINEFPIRIPPLRDRRDEIEHLISVFASEVAANLNRDQPPTFDAEARAWLHHHGWPGNIRELYNVIKRAVLLAERDEVTSHVLAAAQMLVTLPAAAAAAPAPPDQSTTEELRARVIAELTACGGNISRAARGLKISRNTLSHWMDVLGIPRPRPREDATHRLAPRKRHFGPRLKGDPS